MKKICYFIFLCLIFNACARAIISTDKKQDFKIRDNIVILTHDNPEIRDFIVSLKNYLALNIEGHSIKVKKHNLFQDEKYDIGMSNSQYVIDVKVEDISTSFKNQIIGKALFTFNIQDVKTKEIVWTSKVKIKRVFDSDKITIAKRMSKKIVDQLIKDAVL
jgi:hypothetical protein